MKNHNPLNSGFFMGERMAIERASFDILIYRGDTHEEYFQFFKDEELNLPIDLTNVTLKGTTRIGPNDVKWFDIPIKITDAKNGKFSIEIESKRTTEIGRVGEVHNGRFDIQAERLGKVFTFATGGCVVTDDYTYED